MQGIWAAADKSLKDSMTRKNYFSGNQNRKSSSSDESSDSDSDVSCASFKAVPEEFRPNLKLSKTPKTDKSHIATRTSHICKSSLNSLTSEATKKLSPEKLMSEHANADKGKEIAINQSILPKTIIKKTEGRDKTSINANYCKQSEFIKNAIVDQSDKQVKVQELLYAKQTENKIHYKPMKPKSENMPNLKEMEITSEQIRNRVKYERFYVGNSIIQEVKTIEIDIKKINLKPHVENKDSHSKTHFKTKKKPHEHFRLGNAERIVGNHGYFQRKKTNEFSKRAKCNGKTNNFSHVQMTTSHFGENRVLTNNDIILKNSNKVEWAFGHPETTNSKKVHWQIKNEDKSEGFNFNVMPQTKVKSLLVDDKFHAISYNSSTQNYNLTQNTNSESMQHPKHEIKYIQEEMPDSQTLSHKTNGLSTTHFSKPVDVNYAYWNTNLENRIPSEFCDNVKSNSVAKIDNNSNSNATTCHICHYKKDPSSRLNRTGNFSEENRKESFGDSFKPDEQKQISSEIESKKNQNIIVEKLKEITDNIVGGHLALSSLFSFYHEWVISRRKVIDEFNSLAKNIEKSKKNFRFYSGLLEKIQLGAEVASTIPHPYLLMIAKLVTAFSGIAKQIFSKEKSNNIDIDDLDITTVILKEKDTSSSLYMYGLQCNQQFLEIAKLIEQLHSNDIIRNFHDSKADDVKEFITGFLEYNPRQNTFYKKLMKCFYQLLKHGKSSLSEKICEPLSFYTSRALDIVGYLDWRFNIDDFNTESVQYQLEEIFNLLQNKDSEDQPDMINLAKKIKICVSILEDELKSIDQSISKISALDCTFDRPCSVLKVLE